MESDGGFENLSQRSELTASASKTVVSANTTAGTDRNNSQTTDRNEDRCNSYSFIKQNKKINENPRPHRQTNQTK